MRSNPRAGRRSALLALAAAAFAFAQPAAAQKEPTTYLAAEDTFSFDMPGLETMTVTARRVSIEDIIRAIGERMEADEQKIRTQESTMLFTVIAHETDDPDCDDYTLFESADRQRIQTDESIQTVHLWDRERKFRDGKLDEKQDAEKPEKKELHAEWHDIGESLSFAAPFDKESADKYRYELEDRLLVGNNVVYRIDFAPRNRFEALPSGTVWVDYTDLVLRRVEARYTDAVPMPLFLKAIPFLRITAKKMGDFWVADEVHARVELHELPLPNWFARVELRIRMQDYVINGIAYDDAGAPLAASPAPEGGAR